MLSICIGFFILGAIFGSAAVMGYGSYLLAKSDKARLKFTQELVKAANDNKVKMQSAKARIEQAFDITEQQFSILAAIEGPQSGSLHGRHKQQMSAELKRLEEEKMTILRSVLADGIDPKLATVNEAGEKETIKLSDFVARRDLEDAKEGKTPPQIKAPERQKLSLVKNIKDEQ